nr:SRPBCC domain-containing protein [uncultured Psychroserpens sp.]
MKTTDAPIIVEAIFEHSIERVWNAITQVKEMRIWFFDNIPAFEPKVGFKTMFNVSTKDRDFLHIWEIIQVIPKQKIVYHWAYEGYKGNAFVTFELVEQNFQTKLILTNLVIEDFPDDIPDFEWKSCQAGWNYFIKNSLATHLNT